MPSRASIARSRRSRVGYITNNASRTDATVAAHLTELGLHGRARRRRHVAAGGGRAARRARARRIHDPRRRRRRADRRGREAPGSAVTRSADDAPAAVVQGFAPEVGWTDLAEAAFALQARPRSRRASRGSRRTPTGRSRRRAASRPGNGTLVSAVHTAVGRLPVVAGKPERAIFDAAVERFGASSAAVHRRPARHRHPRGESRRASPSALVLTGIDGPKQVLAAAADSRPTFLLGDLRELFEPYPATEIETDDARATASSASATPWCVSTGPRSRIDDAGRRDDRPAARRRRRGLGCGRADLRARRRPRTIFVAR